jgi:hypothetical protein
MRLGVGVGAAAVTFTGTDRYAQLFELVAWA